MKRLAVGACLALLWAGCATTPPVLPEPGSAPLKERRLGQAELDTYGRVTATAGAPAGDAARANYFLGLDEAASGAWTQAGERWQKLAKTWPGTGWDRLAQFKTAEALEKVDDGARAFVLYQVQLTGTAVADLPERAEAACQRLTQTLDEASLRRLAEGYALPRFQPAIRLRLLGMDMAAGRTDAVRAGIDDYLRRFPGDPSLAQLEALSQKLEASVPLDKRALGLLVPLNGPYAPFGAQVRKGVELALATANAGRAVADRFRLAVADEGSTTQTAMEAAKTLVEKEQVIAVVGPLGSDSAAALVPWMAARRVPLFSPSASRPDLAGASPWFFRNTLTPEMQASAMADHVITAMKLTRVATLAPDSAYGNALARAFAARLSELGGSVPVALTYAPGTRDFRTAMLALGGVDPGEAKNADGDEKRDQQAKVEEASTALGGFLLEQAQTLTPPAGVTTTPRLKLLVLDLAQDTATAELNAGRAFADRFARTLAQLPELDVQGPQSGERWWKGLNIDLNHASLQQLAAVGQAAGVDYLLVGGTIEVPADTAKDPALATKRVFNLAAQIIDPKKAEVAAQRRFNWTKYKPPLPNPQGLQAIYLPAPAEDVDRVVPGLIFFDLTLPLLGADQWDRHELQDALPQIKSAVFTAAYWADSPDDAVKRFDQAYRQAYAARPGLLAAQAFDAASLVLEQMKSGVSDRASLRAALARVSGYDGVSGRTSFDGRQDAVKRPVLVGIKDGVMELLKER